ncbi:hypothetical protein RRG08_013770, partial [Elysia crispata]
LLRLRSTDPNVQIDQEASVVVTSVSVTAI